MFDVEKEMKYEKYSKVTNINNDFALCAIYEPHPFRGAAISEAIGKKVSTGIDDAEWMWVYYDWIGNQVGLSKEKPIGTDVEKFTPNNLGFRDDDPNGIMLANYLNAKPPEVGK